METCHRPSHASICILVVVTARLAFFEKALNKFKCNEDIMDEVEEEEA